MEYLLSITLPNDVRGYNACKSKMMKKCYEAFLMMIYPQYTIEIDMPATMEHNYNRIIIKRVNRDKYKVVWREYYADFDNKVFGRLHHSAEYSTMWFSSARKVINYLFGSNNGTAWYDFWHVSVCKK